MRCARRENATGLAREATGPGDQSGSSSLARRAGRERGASGDRAPNRALDGVRTPEKRDKPDPEFG